ncbi:hypothetical protein OKA05_27220 [Luteolibacter arcticus]|uniref:Tip attachment protein J domain-containing protein n=1 Tax=Luteolibacter arcticus TaxID=1581411 RepID=A0ABT3GRX7_9BACT|nr:hypothetical protein [Luteolibacter arcticus]MCW1926275.1 hypothetical protein [Luteolibacter arcticus]
MSATWAINGTALSALGLEFAGGTFNTGTRSIMSLRRVVDMDAAEILPWGTAVTLTRNGTAFFQGKVNSLPTSATGTSEGQEIDIVDAWQDLEDTIYKEEWPAGSSSVMLPIAILGRKSNGAECTDAEQIAEAVNYAADNGVAIQMGSIPAGLPLWQSEVRNVTCAEVIRLSLRFHPDWVPWIDHSTSPPTLNFTPRASMATRTIDIDEGQTESVNITRRDDLKPEAVQILYLNATIIDGQTFRDWIEDIYPAPATGPRVISNVIELAGGQMQFQKQRIQTRTIPTDAEEVREWLKKKYPPIKDIPDAAFTTFHTANTLIPDELDEDLPPPVNPRATRIEREEDDDAEDFPRELVSGSIEDWMRRKVGKVHIDFGITISATATAEERKLLEPIEAMQGKTVTATNAITKVYKGITQWVAPEAAPSGIAAAIYNSLSAYQFEGSITTVMEDVSGDRFHGCKLNITGGKGEWATMNAMVHSVSFDIATGATTISVGPAPFLAAQDMLELRRLLRGRSVTWMSEQERTSNELGADADPGSKGDTVGGFTVPTEETQIFVPPRSMYAPYLGRENPDRLFIHPGTVRFLRIAEEDPADSDELAGLQVTPVFPTIFDTPIDQDTAPFFDVAGRDDCSIWLISDRLRCPGASFVPTEDEETHKLEIYERDEKPAKADGELHTCIAKMDLPTVAGKKTIANLKQLIEGHVDVWYKCLNDESPGSGDDSDDDDFGSSDFESEDEIDPSPSDSKDCKYKIAATWFNRADCYKEGKEVYAVWRVKIGIISIKNRCPGGWMAKITMQGGNCVPYAGQTCDGGTVIVPLTQQINELGAQFRFPVPPACFPTSLTVTIIGDSGDDETPHECCDTEFSQTFASSWPRYCHSTCSTTVVPPP